MTYVFENDEHFVEIEPSLALLPNGEKIVYSGLVIHNDVIKWCDDNFNNWKYSWDSYDAPKIQFECKEDAMGFILRWV